MRLSGALRKARFWIPPLLWMGVMFTVSSLPGKDIPDLGIPHLDKVAHFCEFFIFGVLIARAFFRSFPETSFLKAIIICLVIATAYAGLDEWHQQFIPGRTVDFADFFANLTGIAVSVLVYYFS